MSLVYLVYPRRSATSERWRAAVETALPFFPWYAHSFRCGGFDLVAWDDPAAPSPTARWREKEASAACFDGYGLSLEGRPMSADDLLEKGGLASAWESFHGEWTAVVAHRDGRLEAASASSGGSHLYVASAAGGATLLSNRARLLWWALKASGGKLTPDWECLSWMLSMGWAVEASATAVREVRLVPSSIRLVLDDEYSLPQRVELDDLAPLRARRHEPAAEPDWDQLAHSVVKNLCWLEGAGPTPLAAGLTGGKDSRLVAAAIRRAGLIDRCTFYTIGSEQGLDAVIGLAVAKKIGAAHQVRPVATINDLEAALRRHVALTEGLLGAWDLKGQDRPPVEVSITGFYGEVYRRRGTIVDSDAGAFARRKLTDSQDLTGWLRPEVWHGQLQQLTGWLRNALDRGLPIDLAEDWFYMRVRYPRWVGQTHLYNGLHGLRLAPLLHPRLTDAYYTLPVKERRGERIHYEILRRLDPSLLNVPFAKHTWFPELAPILKEPAAPVLTQKSGAPGLGWQQTTLASSWYRLREALLDRRDELSPLVAAGAVERHLDVAGAVLHLESGWSALRHRARHHRLVRANRGRSKSMLVSTLALLTVTALLDELAAPSPSVHRILGPETLAGPGD